MMTDQNKDYKKDQNKSNHWNKNQNQKQNQKQKQTLENKVFEYIKERTQQYFQQRPHKRIADDLRFLTVSQIIIPYRVSTFLEKRTRLKDIIVALGNLIYLDRGSYRIVQRNQFQKLRLEYNTLKKELDVIKSDFLNRKFQPFDSTCIYLVFRTKKMQQAFLKVFGKDHTICEMLYYKLMNSEEYLQESTQLLKVVVAPEPEDIIWENCQYRRKLSAKVIMVILSLLLTIVSQVIVYSATLFEFTILHANPYAFSGQLYDFYFPSAITITISVFNFVILKVIKMFVYLESCHTKTEEIKSSVKKALLAESVNTIFVPIASKFVVYGRSMMYGEKGLAATVFDMGVANMIVPLLVTIIDPLELFWRLVRSIPSLRRWIVKDKDQEQVNRFYESTSLDLFQIYNDYCLTAIFTGFFMWFQPILLFFAMAGLGIRMWVERVYLLRKYNRPLMSRSKLMHRMLDSLDYFLLAYGIGSLFMIYVTSIELHISDLAPSLLAILLFFLEKLVLPNQSLIEYIRQSNKEQLYFWKDYNVIYEEANFAHNDKYSMKNTCSKVLYYSEEYLKGNLTKKDKEVVLNKHYGQFRDHLPWGSLVIE